jgi:TatA/E family protein of Tat protein translocase
MAQFSPFHWLVFLAIVVLLFGGKKIPEVMRGLGESFRNGPRGGPPTPMHPLPVTSPIETSRGAGDPDKPTGSLFRPIRPK